MPTDLATKMAEMERNPRFRALSPDKQAEERAILREGFAKKYREMSAAKGAANMERLSGAIGPRMAGAMQSVTAGALTMGNEATFGHLPKLASMLPGAGEESQYQALVENAQEAAPMASGVGGLVGQFVGPKGKVLGAAGRVAGTVLGGAAKALGGGKVLGALESEFGRRFAVATLKNLATGTAAITTNEVLRNREDDAGLGQRLSDAASMATNPINLATSVAFGAAQAKFGRPVSAEMASAVARYERITGKRVPIETLTDSSELRKLTDAMAKLPGMSDYVQRQRKAAVAGVAEVVADIRSRSGAAPGGIASVRGQAANAVRGLVGDGTASTLAVERRTAAAGALGTTGSQEIPSHMFGRLTRGWQRLKVGRPRNTKSPELDAAFAEIAKLQTGKSLPTLNEFEALRQQVGKIGHATVLGASTVGGREKFEARRAYDLISALGRRYYPAYGNALNVGKSLRAMENALGDVKVSTVDDAMMESFFRSSGAVKNWNTLVAKSTPDDIAAAKGWLFYRLMGRVSNADGYINPETLDKVVSRRGELNSQLIDKVLPGVLPELRDHAKLTAGMFAKGSGRFGPVGSETSTRGAQMLRLAAPGAIPAAALATAFYFQNPHIAALAVLGPAGVRSVLRSALGGQIENAMQTLSRSGPTGITRSAVAAQQAVPDFGPLKQSMFGIQPGGPQ